MEIGLRKYGYRWGPAKLFDAEVGENPLYFDVDYAAKQMSTNDIRFESTSSWCRIKDDADHYKNSVNRLGRQLTSLKRTIGAEQIRKVCNNNLIPELKVNKLEPLIIETGNRRLFEEGEQLGVCTYYLGGVLKKR
ncbi:hypothetical protein MY10362_009197 [Beauveria mimosiformis]